MYYLVEFACFPEDEIKVFLLDEKKYGDWVIAEPPEGYAHFTLIYDGKIDEIIRSE